MYKYLLIPIILVFCGCSVAYSKIDFGGMCDYEDICYNISSFDKRVSCDRYGKVCLVSSKTTVIVANTTKQSGKFRVACYFYIDGVRMEDIRSKYLFLSPGKNIKVYFYYVFSIPSYSPSNIGVRCSIERGS